MARAEDVLKVARAEIGTKDDGNNRVKYNTEYYGREVYGSAYPWCCVFQWWIFKHAGASDLFYNGKKTASCTTLRGGMSGQRVKEPKAGDIVFFNFAGGNDKVEHVGIVESVNADGSITTIEGNTSVGNNADGGEVMRRKRKGSYIDSYVRPAYSDVVESEDDNTVIKYTVQRGDTLSKIGAKFGVSWRKIAEDNNISNPNLIRVGQELSIWR